MATISPRKTKTGAVTYRVQVRRKGVPALRATFSTLEDAERWGEEKERQIRTMMKGGTADGLNKTVGDLIHRYTADAEAGLDIKMPAAKRAQLTWWREQIGDVPLIDLTRARIKGALDILANGNKLLGGKNVRQSPMRRSGPTRNRYHSALSAAMRYGVEELYWLDHNPCREIRRRKESHGRKRILDDDERRALLDACEQSQWKGLPVLVLLALATGARKGELLGLRWRDVDLKNGRLTFLDTKNGEDRAVPVVGQALTRLRDWAKVRPLDKAGLLFPSAVKPDRPIDPTKYWEAALASSGLNEDPTQERIVFHSLRHTTGSYLGAAKIPATTIAAILGHRTLAMTKRYVKANVDVQEDALKRMHEMLGEGGP